jgi:hypothetical protein
MKKRTFSRATGPILALLLLICQADAQGISETLSGINDLFYGVVAGVASLMLVFHAIKWKTAESPQDRESAKKGMITVIVALALVTLAGTAVDMMYGEKNGGNGTSNDFIVKISTTTRLTTTRRPTTTTIATTTTTTSTTTTTDPYLTAMNLANRIYAAGGFLVSNPAGCPVCVAQDSNVFGREPDGGAAYSKLRKYDPTKGAVPECSGIVGIPTWCSGYGLKVAQSCNTLSELNAAYGFGLKCKPGYNYYDCSGNVIGCP